MTERSQETALARLRELDEALARRGVSREASERVRRALEQRALEQRFHARLRVWPALAFAAAAAVMAAALLYGRERAPTAIPQSTPTQAVEMPGATLEPSCAPLELGPAALEAGQCLESHGVRLSARTPARVEWAPDRVELRAGEILFEVEPRAQKPPLEVRSGEAWITVIGTRFIVHEAPERAWLAMLEGQVQIRVGEHAAEELRAGQALEWRGPAPVSAAEPSPALTPKPSPSPTPADDGLAELLDEVAQLRRAGQYRAAVDRLRAGERERWTPRARQLVSYEIGTLLERQLGDTDAACEHWAAHNQRFPLGRHASSIARSLARMGCDDR